ncbi:MAG: 4-hydroxy-tetrahydrodipicolinate synthase [Clostridia bacterium]|nr:4-hydroxy-tetrahydrodipicolinate synthase [Clostridia bacterium]
MNPLFTGCATALITPFKNGSVDWDALDRIVDNQIENGIAALVAAGTTGEPATMTWEEHLNVIKRIVKRADGRVPVIAGTGSNSTAEAIEAAKFASDTGAAAQLVVTPYYNKTSQAGLVAHFNAIADAADLPVIVYNVPSRTGLNLGVNALKEIVAHPNIIAVKEANDNVGEAMDKVRVCGDKVAFYSGNDDLIVPLMSCGFQGVISVLSNVMPAETVKMCNLALENNYHAASAMQLKLLPFIRALFSETSPIPVKAAMSKLGWCEEELRLPLVPMQDNTRANLYAIMQELNLI